VRLRIKVSGAVQGVGFRYFTLTLARELQVDGWVRNEQDGSVRCEAQGDREILERFLEGLRRGPEYSKVEHVDAHAIDVVPDVGGFVIS